MNPVSELPGDSADAGPALVVDGLSVSYERRGGAARVLDDVAFEIRPGEAYALVGESGCGKSTLAYTLARYLPPNGRVDAGRVVLGGRDVLGLRGEALRRWRATELAMVYQEPGSALNPTMTVGAQIAEVLRLQGASPADTRAGVVEMLRTVAMPDPEALMRRYPHQLSGGQQQRVVIAMALAVRPRLLVLDEPTTGLDATVEAEVLALVESLREELAASVLFISHNLGLVGRLCDRIGVLYAGRLVEEGTTAEVLGAPQHPYTAGLLGCVPRFGVRRETRALTPIAGSLPRLAADLPGCAFAPRCGLADDLCRAHAPALEPAGAAGAPDRKVRCRHPGKALPVAAPGRAGTAEPDGSRRPPEAGLLDVRHLTARYGRVVACHDVSLTIGYGEVLGLVGESGSGKTTLGRAIVGLMDAYEGEVVFEGDVLAAAVGRRPADVRRRLQMVFQSPDATLNPRRTVRDVLRRSIQKLHGRLTVERLAERVRIEAPWLASVAARLSGGQKQRVAIGRAFAGQPALVVCDEPVSALDVSVQAAILELLGELQDEQRTSYLFISHDLAVVHYLADRLAVMYLGQIVEQGPAAAVFRAPRHPYTAALVAATPRLDAPEARPARLAGEGPSLADPPAGCRFHTRCPHHMPGTCDEVPAPWRDLGGGHEVRCHLESELLLADPRLRATTVATPGR